MSAISYGSYEEAARAIGVSRATLATLIKSGAIPRHKVSRRKVLIRHEDLDKYVRSLPKAVEA